MAKGLGLLFAIAVLSVLVGAQDTRELEHASGEADFIGPTAGVGSTVTCSQPPVVLRVPASVIERAKTKLRLINLLRESLLDDSRGIVNIAREKEIKKLVSELKDF